MLFMVIETYREGAAPRVYRRFKEQGRMAPVGLRYIDSWVDHEFLRCFQIMEGANEDLLREWMSHWTDLVDFEVIPVMSSEEAARRMDGE